MSLEYKKIEERYFTDGPFNKMVNLFRQLIEEYGFLPQEIREGLFFAQYQFEMSTVKTHVRSELEWEQINELHQKMQNLILNDYPALSEAISRHNGTAKE